MPTEIPGYGPVIRFAGINGRLRHEQFDSTLPNRDYNETSVYLGLKLQR